MQQVDGEQKIMFKGQEAQTCRLKFSSQHAAK